MPFRNTVRFPDVHQISVLSQLIRKKTLFENNNNNNNLKNKPSTTMPSDWLEQTQMQFFFSIVAVQFVTPGAQLKSINDSCLTKRRANLGWHRRQFPRRFVVFGSRSVPRRASARASLGLRISRAEVALSLRWLAKAVDTFS